MAGGYGEDGRLAASLAGGQPFPPPPPPAVFDRCEYWRLRDSKGKPPSLLGFWPSRAVTFLENHDTVRCGLGGADGGEWVGSTGGGAWGHGTTVWCAIAAPAGCWSAPSAASQASWARRCSPIHLPAAADRLLQGSSQGHWRFPGHAVEQGYAYILTHPGTPCVFWDHLSDQRLRDTVGRLVACRKRNGLNCRSAVRRCVGEGAGGVCVCQGCGLCGVE